MKLRRGCKNKNLLHEMLISIKVKCHLSKFLRCYCSHLHVKYFRRVLIMLIHMNVLPLKSDCFATVQVIQ